MSGPALHLERAHWRQGRTVAGLDEAGRGAWAGPVVAAVVVLPARPRFVARFLAGVDDSKRLSAGRRQYFAGRIQEIATVGLGVIPAATIDEIGIVPATLQAMELALAALPSPPGYLLIDHIPRPLGRWPQQCLVRGESESLSIAAASIMAKVHRDGLMAGYEADWPGYDFARHKGYGTPQHRAALARLGPTPLHRHSWAPLLQPRLPLDPGAPD